MCCIGCLSPKHMHFFVIQFFAIFKHIFLFGLTNLEYYKELHKPHFFFISEQVQIYSSHCTPISNFLVFNLYLYRIITNLKNNHSYQLSKNLIVQRFIWQVNLHCILTLLLFNVQQTIV